MMARRPNRIWRLRGIGGGQADIDVWLWPRTVREGWKRPLRAGGPSSAGADRPAAVQRRPVIPEKTGGDLSIQACADDPQVAFHAVRELARLAYDSAQLRWAQTGFISKPVDGSTPRNLMGFKDGTQQPADINATVWAVADSPDWMQGGSYLVVRRIRMALEHWDRTNVFQEQTMGRHKQSGAPLGLKDEFAPLRLDRNDQDENPVIPEHAHVRLGNAAENASAEMMRRGYSYNDGANFPRNAGRRGVRGWNTTPDSCSSATSQTLGPPS